MITKSIFSHVLRSTFSKKYNESLMRCSSPLFTSSVLDGEDRVSRAMKVYMEKAETYDKFMKEQLQEFELGKKHLANIMGRNNTTMTQKDIDEAIEYLLPSGLFVPRARPFMKPPNETFAKKKAVEFDVNGRPFHSLFYTTTPHFSQLLHNAAVHLENLNKHQKKIIKNNSNQAPPQPLSLLGSKWFTKEELENKLLEKLTTLDYEKFLEVLTCLAEHPYSSLAEDFINTYRLKLSVPKLADLPAPVVLEDGSILVKAENCKRDTASANVTLKYPGKGIIKINGMGIDYFKMIQSREQASNLM